MIAVHVLRAGGRLEPLLERLMRVTDHTLERIQSLMPVDAVDIVFYDNPSWTISETGISGYAPDAHLVQIWLDPASSALSAGLEVELSATLAHELHHAKRWRDPGYGQTLLEALVTEGLAQCFELPFRDGEPPIYARALEPAQVNVLLELARAEFDAPHYNHRAWFITGDAQKDIPGWAGYTLGYEMVKRFLEITAQTPAQAVAMRAETVLETLEAHP
jgi:uncharacterized protein YjaZ